MNFTKKLAVKPGTKVKLKKWATDETFGVLKETALAAVPKQTSTLGELHQLLYAEHRHFLLIVLQGMDAAGKDGTIKHVMAGTNPQGCNVTAFKEPTKKELDHDFLWRVHAAVPGKGDIGIFNRSHYEDVLVVRVHKLAPESVWSQRYEQINAFESLLSAYGTHILKFFLHIDNVEQEKRLQARLSDSSKNWKASAEDFLERRYWDDYQTAYEDALSKCSTDAAPWYIIPANNKWFRDYAISEIVIKTLKGLHMKFPKADPELIKTYEAKITVSQGGPSA